MEVGRTAEYDTSNGTAMDKDSKSPKVSYVQGVNSRLFGDISSFYEFGSFAAY